MTFRAMRWTDIEELVVLERELFEGDAWSAATWWSELGGRPRREYFVEAAVDGPRTAPAKVLGYAGIDHQGEVADLMTIAVAPAAQGTGLGRRLLTEVIGRAAVRGATGLLLEVRSDNLAARSLYETAGFETLTVRRRYYQPDDVDALVMRRQLQRTEGAGRAG